MERLREKLVNLAMLVSMLLGLVLSALVAPQPAAAASIQRATFTQGLCWARGEYHWDPTVEVWVNGVKIFSQTYAFYEGSIEVNFSGTRMLATATPGGQEDATSKFDMDAVKLNGAHVTIWITYPNGAPADVFDEDVAGCVPTPVPTFTPTPTNTATWTPVPPTATETATLTETPLPPTQTATVTVTPPPATATETPVPASPTIPPLTFTPTATMPAATRTVTPVPATPTPTESMVPPAFATITPTPTWTLLPPPVWTASPTVPAPTSSPAPQVTATATSVVVHKNPKPEVPQALRLFGYVYPCNPDVTLESKVLNDPEFHHLITLVKFCGTSDKKEDLPAPVKSGTAHLFIVPTSVPVAARVTPGIGEQVEEVTHDLSVGQYEFVLPGLEKLDPSSLCVEAQRDGLAPTRVCGASFDAMVGKSPRFKAQNIHWAAYPLDNVNVTITYDLSPLEKDGFKFTVVQANGFNQVGTQLWTKEVTLSTAEPTETNFLGVDIIGHGKFSYDVTITWNSGNQVQWKTVRAEGTNW